MVISHSLNDPVLVNFELEPCGKMLNCQVILKLKRHHVVTNRPDKTLHSDEPISCRVLLHVTSVVKNLPDDTIFPYVFF